MGRKPTTSHKMPRLSTKRVSVAQKMKKMRAAQQAKRDTLREVSLSESEQSILLQENDSFLYCDSTDDEGDEQRFSTSETSTGGASENGSLPELHIENCEEELQNEISGRRIVDIAHFFKALKSLKHDGFGCSFFNMDVVREKRQGFASIFTLRCNMCNQTATVCTESGDEGKMAINVSAVSGIMAVGGGFSQINEFAAALDIPAPSHSTYAVYHNEACDIYSRAAINAMKKAAEEERRLAIEARDVDSEGYPTIAVVADGAWSKRSYRTNYNASSGVACIVGLRTGKVLYEAVKNRFCLICARKDLYKNNECPKHTCYKNWTGTSTAMEAAIIVEGFQTSVDMYGIKYTQLVGDGDSSVYRKLIECMPYGPSTVIQKIECKNHILRNYINKLKECCKKTKVEQRLKNAISNNILRFRTAVTKAIEFRKNQALPTSTKIRELECDILNGPKHIFGDHSGCPERGYFCKGPKEGEINIVEDLQKSGILEDVMSAVRCVAYHSKSLVYDVTNNVAELYNSHVAKIIGGKRVNFSLRRSYQGRCDAAVVAHNEVGGLHEIVQLTADKIPGRYTSQYCQTQKRKLHSRQVRKPEKRIKMKRTCEEDADYGPNAAEPVPDMGEEELESATKKFILSLSENTDKILEQTVGQHRSNMWLEERRKRLTASNFGRICKLRESTSCANTVKNLLYNQFSGNAGTRYGKENEHRAIEEFEKTMNMKVQACGLFVDTVYPFLGASPDGIVDENAIVEIKCPYSARMCKPVEGVLNKKIAFCDVVEDKLKLKARDIYMYQVQGQLNITKKEICYFVVWTPLGISVEVIHKDITFWETNMLPKLKKFYMTALLPEIIDPRQSRKLPLRKTFI